MIAGKLVDLEQYKGCIDYVEEILAFVKRTEEENLADGRYEILGENLFALVQTYVPEPKENKRMEAHKLYADLQYMRNGREMNYWDHTDELTVYEDKTPDADVLFYERRPEKGSLLLESGMFGYYAPEDAHLPGAATENPVECKKIVFKIRKKP